MKSDTSRVDPLELNIARRNTVGDMLGRTARLFPERLAVVDGEAEYTFRELNDAAENFAHSLLKYGHHADRDLPVAVLMGNSYETLVNYFGVVKAGLIVMPINVAQAPADIQWLLNDSGAKTVVIDAPFIPLLTAETEQPKVDFELVITRGQVSEGELPASASAADFHELMVSRSEGPVRTFIGSEDIAQCLYTSGTTSRPKAALHTHNALVLSSMVNGPLFGMRWDRGPYRAMLPLPLFHVAALSVVALPTLAYGGTVVLPGPFDPARVIDLVVKYQIQHVAALPMMWAAMVKANEQIGADLSCVERGTFGMQPMPAAVLEAVGQLVPNAEVLQTAGQTEVLPGVVTQWEAQNPGKNQAWGMPSPTVEINIMAEDGRMCAPGEIGEIVYRGPHVTPGYVGRPEANEEAFAHGWFHSGDVGHQDEDGTVWFADRAKDIVKTGGENVSSQKVEAVLMEAPGVVEVSVIGTPHEHWGEAVTAVVLSDLVEGPEDPRTSEVEAEIIEFARERLAGFETPKAVRFVEALPRTSTGKIQKNILKDMFKE